MGFCFVVIVVVVSLVSYVVVLLQVLGLPGCHAVSQLYPHPTYVFLIQVAVSSVV